MPGIRKIPLRAIGIILFIALLNAIVWIAAAIVLVRLINLFHFFPANHEERVANILVALSHVC
jgi:hypothetical protein